MNPKICRTVVVSNEQGLHARPADLLVKTASRFQSKIELVKNNERVDGKSILAVLTLAAVQGTQLCIEADGHDAQAALDAICVLIEHNFAEEDSEKLNHDDETTAH